jgi:flagellar basal-body rod modification protein FlgD
MATGILNHMMTAGQALKGMDATPMAGSTSGSGGTSGTNGTTGTSGSDSSDDSSSDSTISANDFLTLLVTEMQNQDPTADTDPNEYINQLVQVNSLEQLIDINQTLTTDLGPAPASSSAGSSGQVAGATTGATATSPLTAPAAAGTAHAAGAQPAAASAVPAASAQTTAARRLTGNVGVPGVNPAAQRVGHALSGRTPARHVKDSPIPLQ